MIVAEGVTERLAVDINCAGAAALTILIWEMLITLDQEVKHIWSRPNTAWLKWMFIFMRYFTLAVLICDRGLNLSTLYNYDLHESTLRAWYIVQPIMAHVCMLSVEALMMARVYGMYHRRTRVLLLFLLVLLLDTIVVVVGVAVNVPSFDQITRAYFVRYSSPALSYFGVSSFITQVLILTFMMLSYRREWRTTPLVQLIVRDGLLVFGVFVVFCACMTVYPVMHFFATAAAYPWLLTSISCAGCRLILNMQTVPEATAPASSALVQLTTYYTIPPQTLDDNEQQDGS